MQKVLNFHKPRFVEATPISQQLVLCRFDEYQNFFLSAFQKYLHDTFKSMQKIMVNINRRQTSPNPD